MPPKPLPPTGEIVLYPTEDGRARVECRFAGETVWLTQALIAELFDIGIPTVNEHLKDIYEDRELDPEATIRKFRIVRREGTREARRAGLRRQRRHSYQPRATPWVYGPKTILSAESAIHRVQGLRPGDAHEAGFQPSGIVPDVTWAVGPGWYEPRRWRLRQGVKKLQTPEPGLWPGVPTAPSSRSRRLRELADRRSAPGVWSFLLPADSTEEHALKARSISAQGNTLGKPA
jgi:hypothetical protein